MPKDNRQYTLNREAMRRWLGGARMSGRVFTRLSAFVESNGNKALPESRPSLTDSDRVEYMKQLKPCKVDDPVVTSDKKIKKRVKKAKDASASAADKAPSPQ